MPTVQVNGARLHFDRAGDGDQTIVFIHGLMLASESYDAQVEALKDRYRIITFDLRGQGRSEKTKDRLDIDSLAQDAVALIEAMTTDRVHVVAFSMGTFIAMRIAARRPDLVRSLCLVGPSADAEEPENMPKYRRLIQFVRVFGPRLVASRLMMILFGDTYLNAPEVAAQRQRWLRVVEQLPRALHRAAAASARRQSIAGELPRIAAPTLIVSGTEDRPISPARARAVHAGIAGSRFLAFEDTGHAVMIERAEAFNAALIAFLRDVSSSGG